MGAAGRGLKKRDDQGREASAIIRRPPGVRHFHRRQFLALLRAPAAAHPNLPWLSSPRRPPPPSPWTQHLRVTRPLAVLSTVVGMWAWTLWQPHERERTTMSG